ncbi:MAG: hypothetical protein KAQ75_16150 [Bacteroidales bacterium]|nr:hypothetical protein [Bacteroidales bacterium]
METLINFVLKFIESKNPYLILGVVFSIFFIFLIRFYIKNYDNVIKAFGFLRKFRKNKELLNLTDSVSDKEILDLKETNRFQQYFGIYVEKKRREKLINFHNKHELKITWKEVKAAYHYIKFEETGISINIKKTDKFSYNASIIVSVLLMILGMLGILFTIGISDELNQKQFSAFLILFLPFIFLGLGIIRLNWGLSCAIKINNVINSLS